MGNIKELLVLHHNHIDIGYTHPQTVFWELSDRFINDAIEICERTSDFPEESRMRWTCEVTAPVIHWLDKASGNQIDRIRNLVRSRQFAFGSMFCNLSALYNTEEMIQSFYPVKRIKEAFGANISVAINHDINGLSWSLVGLLKDIGVENLLMGINVHMGGYPFKRPGGFFWEGPDKEKILVFNGEHYNMLNRVMKLSETEDMDVMAAGLDKYIAKLKANKYPYDFVYLSATHPAFNDNNPPDIRLPTMIKKWNESGKNLKIRMITPEMLFERLRKQTPETLPVHRGDWVDYWTFGCASSALEVAANRQARSTFMATQALDSLSNVSFNRQELMKKAFWNIAIADEHTWGSFCSTGNFCPSSTIEPFPVAEQWYLKAVNMYRGRSLSNMILRDLLEETSGNPSQGKGLKGLMLFNPNPVPKKEVIKIPREVMEQEWFHISSKIHQINIYQSFLNEETAFFLGPVDLKAYEYKIIYIGDVKTATIDEHVKAENGYLENSYYRLEFDTITGHITSIIDKDDERELTDNSNDLHMFEPVLETLEEPTTASVLKKDVRESFSELDWERWHAGEDCWNPDWKGKYERPTLKEIKTVKSPVGVKLMRIWSGPGKEEIEQTITLVDSEKKIRFEAYFNKKDNIWPESLYFAFPLSVKNGKVHYDSGAIATEYGNDYLKGGCLDWFTVNSWVASHNDKGAIVIAAPDSPLFMAGGFNFAKRLKSKHPESSSMLLGWVMNNYWNTNFRVSQPGYIRIRYEITSFSDFDEARCSAFGQSVMLPFEWHPVINDTSPASGQLVHICSENNSVQLLQMKKSEDNKGVVIRVLNYGSNKNTIRIKLPGYAINKAYKCDLLENTGHELPVEDNAVVFSPNYKKVESVYIKAYK